MKSSRTFFLIFAVMLLTAWTAYGRNTQADYIQGLWMGTLSYQGTELRLVFKIDQPSKDNLEGTLDSPDQGASGIPLHTIAYTDTSIHFGVAVIKGDFYGKMQEDKSSIVGTWSQSGLELPLTLQRTDKVEGPKRPQNPREPYPYIEEYLLIENKIGGDTLAGTLTLPKTGSPFTAILLITGSGPQDRDETIMGHRPFWVLADYLTRLGYAVLRFDDRGVGMSTGDFASATTDDFVTDAQSCISLLKTRKDINPAGIGVIGHSEGAIVGTIIAAKSNDLAFAVNIAGPGLCGDDLILLQSKLIAKAEGVSDEMITTQQELQRKLFTIAKYSVFSETAELQMRDTIRKEMDRMSNEDIKAMGMTPEVIAGQIAMLNSPWYRNFLKYDPTSDLKKVKCPLLVIMGEKDLQVPPGENRPLIEDALKASGNPHYEIHVLPGLNHLLQTVDSGKPSDYAKIEETISPAALKLIGDWIGKQK